MLTETNCLSVLFLCACHSLFPSLPPSLCSCWSRRWWLRSSWGGQLTWTWPRTPVTRPWLSTLASLRWNVWQSPTSTCPKNLWPGTSLPMPCCTKVCGPLPENTHSRYRQNFLFVFFFFFFFASPSKSEVGEINPAQMTFTGQNYWHAFFMRHLSAHRPSVLCVCVCVCVCAVVHETFMKEDGAKNMKFHFSKNRLRVINQNFNLTVFRKHIFTGAGSNAAPSEQDR